MTIIHTGTGTHFDLANPSLESININDIANGLSKLCRFTGHSSAFYSVAEHCYRASYIPRNRKAQFAALMHDAHEAYVGDVSSPLKELLPDYKLVEQRIWDVVHACFNVSRDHETQNIVLDADLRMLATEKRDLLPGVHTYWPILKDVNPMPGTLVPMDHRLAKKCFMRRFDELSQPDAMEMAA
jgi:uncharacterized protein